MRQFASASLRLYGLPREAKIIYTFFCALSLLALLSSLLLYGEVTGGTRPGALRRVGAYYGAAGGPTRGAGEGTVGGAGGPAIELSAEETTAPAAGELTVAVPYRKLLEVTHFHLFTMPVFLLIISHLFVMSGLSRRTKTAWVLLGWCAATLHIAAPWLVRSLGARAALAYPISGAGLLCGALVMTAYPVLMLWLPPRRGEQKGRS